MDGRLTVFVWEPAELSWDEHPVARRECGVCLRVEVLAEGVDSVARDTSGSKERTQPASLQVVVANRQTNAYKQRRIKPPDNGTERTDWSTRTTSGAPPGRKISSEAYSRDYYWRDFCGAA